MARPAGALSLPRPHKGAYTDAALCSGCSTFLKTLANAVHGFHLAEETKINYRGITPAQMKKNFAGETIYSAETEDHLPMLTVGQTLEFAAMARAVRPSYARCVSRSTCADLFSLRSLGIRLAVSLSANGQPSLPPS